MNAPQQYAITYLEKNRVKWKVFNLFLEMAHLRDGFEGLQGFNGTLSNKAPRE
jgi:hypothetical protein